MASKVPPDSHAFAAILARPGHVPGFVRGNLRAASRAAWALALAESLREKAPALGWEGRGHKGSYWR